MTLPQALQAGIDGIVAGGDRREVERAARALSDSYRVGGSAAARAARTNGDVIAYLATRAPATYAAAAAVFEQIGLARPGWAPASVLDLGAGPGIAAWAATEAWPGISSVSLVDAEPEMERAGKALAADGPAALRDARWRVADAGGAGAKADLVLVSYVIGELGLRRSPGFVHHAWSLAGDTLVIVEPGTTAGYERVLAAAGSRHGGWRLHARALPRDNLPVERGRLVPLRDAAPRSRTHRLRRAPSAASRTRSSPTPSSAAAGPRREPRIIRRPDLRQGHVVLDLCTTEGLERRTVSKRDGAEYRKARKLGWGDTI